MFDKALGEPGFSEIYATLCFDLNKELPTFKDEAGEEGGSDITFRRLLLNKCQEEFEEGDAAMAAVEARERAQQAKDAAGVRARRPSRAPPCIPPGERTCPSPYDIASMCSV